MFQTEIIKKLENLKIDKSLDIDNLRPKLLYEARTEIGEALANLFVKSFESGSTPRNWKDVIMVTLFKEEEYELAIQLQSSKLNLYSVQSNGENNRGGRIKIFWKK